MSDANTTIESAVSDVGYWRWWAEALPDAFQLEFGGVQLWSPPIQPGSPPSGIVALRFKSPSVVAFLTDEETDDVPSDWRQALHEDRIEPFTVHYDAFTLNSEELFTSICERCVIEFIVGAQAELTSTEPAVKLAFRAGGVGLALRAESMTVITSAGELSPSQIIEASEAWWTYWREYWDRRDTDAPLPNDYACEVTIPLKGD